MSGHSPAPWTFRPNPCECPDCTAAFWIDSAPRSADERIGVPIGEVRDLGKASEANVRLIAAAPEMAEALAWILMDAGMLVDALRHPTLAPLTGRQIDGIAARIKAARTTYNKARGGA